MSTWTNFQQADDRATILSIIMGQVDAWNQGDAQAFAQHYREDGSFTNIAGMRVYGKAGFVNAHTQIFASIFAGSHLSLTVDRICFVQANAAVVDIDALLTDIRRPPPGMNLAGDGALHSKLQQTLVRDDDGWSIVSFHNVAVAHA